MKEETKTRIRLLEKNVNLLQKILDNVNKPTKSNNEGKANPIILTYINTQGTRSTHIINTIIHQNIKYTKILIEEIKKTKGAISE